MPPLVAVILPTYNRETLLDRSVRSVLAQTWRDFELVIVDDGSTDATAGLPVLRLPDARLRYMRLPDNRGVSVARNIGVAATTSPLIAFLDSDDEWLPEKLEKQVQWFKRRQEEKIVQTREIWIRRGKRVNPPKTHEKFQGDLFAASLERCMITPSSVMLRRTLFEQMGGFNESLPACEDYDLWLKVTSRYAVGLVDEYLLKRYGGRDDQLSATVPTLDRYRIQSMIALLSGADLSLDRATLCTAALRRRLDIVAGGCKKHGNTKEYERYTRIIEQYC